MFEPKGLLKVMSILMILFGAIGAIVVVLGYLLMPQLAELSGIDTSIFTPLAMAQSVVTTICCMMAGIFGVSGKSLRWTVIFGGIHTLLVIYEVITTTIASGFTFVFIISIIVPLLFWWGVYQSKEA